MLRVIEFRDGLAARDLERVALVAAYDVDAVGVRACGRLLGNHDFTCPLGGLWPGRTDVQPSVLPASGIPSGAVYFRLSCSTTFASNSFAKLSIDVTLMCVGSDPPLR